MNFIKNIAYPLVLVFFSGCASIMSGNQTRVTIKTDAPAKITVLDAQNRTIRKGNSPLRVSLRTSTPVRTLDTVDNLPAEYFIKVQSLSDLKNVEEFKISANINPWVWGNVAFLFPFGWMALGIDYKSGAAWRFEDNYEFNLRKI